MTSIHELASAYGLTTADKIAPPEPGAPKHHEAVRMEALARRWPLDKRMRFRDLAPAALALVASDGPVSVTLFAPDGRVSRRIGHNRAVWPARFVATSNWSDTVTPQWDRNPLVPMRMQFRIWCADPDARDRLAEAAVEMLAARAESDGGCEALRRDYVDLGPDLDLAMLEMELHALAERLLIAPVWDDEGLSRFLEQEA